MYVRVELEPPARFLRMPGTGQKSKVRSFEHLQPCSACKNLFTAKISVLHVGEGVPACKNYRKKKPKTLSFSSMKKASNRTSAATTTILNVLLPG